VVVTSYSLQRLRDIYDLLDSLRVQTYPNINVVFIGERTRRLLDEVRSYAVSNGMADILLKFNNGRWGLSESRNLGVKEARGEIIAFLDDDVVLHPQWAEEMMRTYLQYSDVIGITGPSVPLWIGNPPDWFPEQFDWILGIYGSKSWMPFKSTMEVRNVWGNNFSFRSSAFASCGLFSPDYGFPRGTFEGFLGEDNEFSMRVRRATGKRIVFNPKAWVYHKVYGYRLKQAFIVRRAFYMGRSRRLIKELHEPNGRPALAMEYAVVQVVLTGLLKKALTRRRKDGVKASLRMVLTVMIILVAVALGYCSYRSYQSIPQLQVNTR
jgi:GT2 family glycosyltransferase